MVLEVLESKTNFPFASQAISFILLFLLCCLVSNFAFAFDESVSFFKAKRHGVLIYSAPNLGAPILKILKEQEIVPAPNNSLSNPRFRAIFFKEVRLGYVLKKDLVQVDKRKEKKKISKKLKDLYKEQGLTKNYIGVSYGPLDYKWKLSSRRLKKNVKAASVHIRQSGDIGKELPLDFNVFFLTESHLPDLPDEFVADGFQVIVDTSIRNLMLSYQAFEVYVNWGFLVLLSNYKIYQSLSSSNIKTYNLRRLKLGFSAGLKINSSSNWIGACRPHVLAKWFSEKENYTYVSGGISCAY